jgi:hypothetical protein
MASALEDGTLIATVGKPPAFARPTPAHLLGIFPPVVIKDNPSSVLDSDVFEASKGTDAYTINDFGAQFL